MSRALSIYKVSKMDGGAYGPGLPVHQTDGKTRGGRAGGGRLKGTGWGWDGQTLQ